jgi:hypothetical protein
LIEIVNRRHKFSQILLPIEFAMRNLILLDRDGRECKRLRITFRAVAAGWPLLCLLEPLDYPVVDAIANKLQEYQPTLLQIFKHRERELVEIGDLFLENVLPTIRRFKVDVFAPGDLSAPAYLYQIFAVEPNQTYQTVVEVSREQPFDLAIIGIRYNADGPSLYIKTAGADDEGMDELTAAKVEGLQKVLDEMRYVLMAVEALMSEEMRRFDWKLEMSEAVKQYRPFVEAMRRGTGYLRGRAKDEGIGMARVSPQAVRQRAEENWKLGIRESQQFEQVAVSWKPALRDCQ